MNKNNIILATDSYKLNHWKQYPKDTEGVYSYFEAREGAQYPATIFFGLQALIKEHLEGVVVSANDIREARILSEAHFGADNLFNDKGWIHIVQEHGGKLPVKIKAVPEGTRVPNNNVLMTVENTCPRCYWLTNALESLLVHVWYPSTVATLSHDTIEMIGGYLDVTGGSRDGLGFMLHDFGYRGASSHETALMGGMAHLINSRGTDTLPGMLGAMNYYDANLSDLAFSVPATEHSVMTSRGRDGEYAIVDRLLREYPTGILSVVSDSYDVEAFVKMLGKEFKDEILGRSGKFVVRPDSLRSNDDTPEAQMADLSTKLYKEFGGKRNEAGFIELDEHVGLLWGDGIGPDGIDRILATTKARGFAASNYVFGMGGGLLQKVNRDTQKFAFKCSAQKRNGSWHPVQKGTHGKRSKAGRLELVRDHGDLTTIEEPKEWVSGADYGVLQTVFENGELVKEYTFDEVRANAIA